MKQRIRMIARMLLFGLLALATLASGAWGALALWYQLPGGTVVKILGSVTWSLVVIVLAGIAISRRSWLPPGIYLVLYALLLLWWGGIAPSNLRDWADDVSRPLTGRIEGNQVVLDNVRDFAWRTDTDYDAHWETRRYDLDRLVTADAVLSYWGSQAIAHAMISFGFDDGRHLVFSVEIRKRRGQKFSSIGGFFKNFESILIASPESDIVRVRTNVRGEDDYLYPLSMSRDAMRALFLSYTATANRLVDHPEFYNTITSNCTTMVYRMARQLDPGLPWDARLLVTGYLPGYLYKIGALDHRLTLDEWNRRARITERARASKAVGNFSAAIRTPLR